MEVYPYVVNIVTADALTLKLQATRIHYTDSMIIVPHEKPILWTSINFNPGIDK